MAIGQTVGSLGGFALGGPAGAAVGGGLGQLYDSSQQADAAQLPPATDPQQLTFLNELDQKRKAINTGTEFAVGEREANQALANTQDNIVKTTGGDIGATVNALNTAQRTAGNNINALMAHGQENQKFFTSMAEDMLDRISDRRLQLQLAARAQNLAESKQSQQDGSGNIAGQEAKSGYKGIIPFLNGISGGNGSTPPGAMSATGGGGNQWGSPSAMNPQSMPLDQGLFENSGAAMGGDAAAAAAL